MRNYFIYILLSIILFIFGEIIDGLRLGFFGDNNIGMYEIFITILAYHFFIKDFKN